MPWILAESVRDLNLGLPHLKRKTKYSKKKKKKKSGGGGWAGRESKTVMPGKSPWFGFTRKGGTSGGARKWVLGAGYTIYCCLDQGFPVAQLVKNRPAMPETWV